MDIKTVYGFILIGIGFAFNIIAKQFGIDGIIEETTYGVISAGLFLVAGIGLNQYIKTK